MKFGKLDFTIPTPAEIIAGLDVDADTGLKLAREVATNARRELAHATQRLEEAGARVADLKVKVPDGRAALGDLEAALREQAAAAMVLPGHQQRVIDAEKNITTALQRAKQAIVTEAGRRRDTLQAVADRVVPVLNALRDGEEALDDLMSKIMGQPACVAAVEWPCSLEHSAVISHGKQLAGSVGIPVRPAYPGTVAR